jgi:hypothetical protein
VDWLRRVGRPPQPEGAAPATTPASAAHAPQATPPKGVVERASPGIAALLSGVAPDGSHAVLDLGQAAESSLRLYSKYARKVRFADLLAAATEGGWPKALSDLPTQDDHPYNLVLAWDVLERISPEERRRLMARLTQVSSSDARMFVGVDASGSPMSQPLRYTLLDVDRLRCEPTGPARPARPPILPAEVEKVLAPFQVMRAFTLKGNLREYVAIRR